MPPPPRTIEVPRSPDASGTHSGNGADASAHKPVDSKPTGFDAPGHASGTKQPGDVAEAGTPESLEIKAYKEAQQKKWQAEKDAQARDKLFNQPTTGRVDGKEVDSFSVSALEESAEALVKAEKANPLRRKDILKTAGITAAVTVPFTFAAIVGGATVNELLKPYLNPLPVAATEQSVMEGRLVGHTMQRVFLLANTLADLRSEPHVGPSVAWMANTNDERMDNLEEMLGFIETAFRDDAKKVGISFEPPSTGKSEDDITLRATAMESRMAALTALMGAMKEKLTATAA
ncbi:hypothetical protein [Pseudomonas sp. B22129]|uniref:hypothetical protein n=1 Tax=Pseudomonas sp. B22129 TaxID=3235111 RepID=UPI003783BEC7